LLRRLWALRPLSTLGLLAARTLPSARTLRRPGPALFFFPRRRSCSLLEFLDLLFHETPGLGLASAQELVVAAVGAAPPAFGVGLSTLGTENAFWERHRESARIVHFDPRDKDLAW
jgi:hypothetical protein